MAEAVWARRSRPLLGSAAHSVGCWEPASVGEVTAHRRELAGTLRRAWPPGADEDAGDRLLLVFEELASNALRHGSRPIRVELTFDHDSWLLDVTDGAVDRPPIPAVGRDAAEGGLGLYLVARLCPSHGWTVAGARKHVWARVGFAGADASEAVVELVPQPRMESADTPNSADPAR